MATLPPRRGANSTPKTEKQNHLGSAPPKRPRPEGKKLLQIRVAGFKPNPNPYRHDEGGAEARDDRGEQYSFKILANAELVEALGEGFLEDWMKVNPREQNLSGPIMRAVEETWNTRPSEFFRVNRGLVLSAESVRFDKDSGIAEILLSDQKRHGVVDGGHTFRKVVEELIPQTYGLNTDEQELSDAATACSTGTQAVEDDESETIAVQPVDRYLSCELWTGLTLEQVALLSQGRNTSRTVPPYAILQMRGAFEQVREALTKCNAEFANATVAFRPNEHVEIEGVQDYKPISILEILQLLMAMDITNYSADDHPIEAYKNQGFVARYWNEDEKLNRRDEYRKMLPLIGDFLELYDRVREVVPEAYDNATSRPKKCPRRWSKVLAGKGEKVDRRREEPLYYLDPSGNRKTAKSPKSLFYPIFCAFRACLRIAGDGRYQWIGGKSPTRWPDHDFAEACTRLAMKIAKAAMDKDSLHAVGRDEQVWQTCYETLNAFLSEYKSRN